MLEPYVTLWVIHFKQEFYCFGYTVTTKTEYFDLHSPIATLAEYFVCFLDEIEYYQLLWEFASVVNYIRCNLILHRL